MLVCLAAAVAALTWPVGTAPAAAATPQTWTYVQGLGGYPFELETQPDGTLGTGLSVVDGSDGGQTIEFLLSAADVSSVAPATQVVDSPSTLPFDIPLSGAAGVKKTFYYLGGTLDMGGNAGVTVALSYSVEDASGAVQSWQTAGVADNGTFNFALSGDPSGKTIAYELQITAPAVVMSTPVVISNVTITYGAYATPKPKPKPKPSPKPKPKPKPTAKSTASSTSGSGGQGNDSGSSATDTGNGNGTGAGNGNGSGNVSGGAAHASSATRRVAKARATTNVALPPSSPTGSAGSVSGYALTPSSVVAASAVEGSAVHKSGGHAQGGGASSSHGLIYVALGACLAFAVAAPWPLASRRLRALATFEHDEQAASGQPEEWLEERPPHV